MRKITTSGENAIVFMVKNTLKVGLVFAGFLLLNACGSSSSSSDPKQSPSYNTTLYDSFTTTTVNYGRSADLNGSTQTYAMDIYQPPAEDTNVARPLIIYAHGGFFKDGDKNEAGGAENGMGEFFAKSGYVFASINYRLIPSSLAGATLARLNLSTSSQISTASLSVIAALDAMNDMRAAIRYFLADAENKKTYKIDTNNIFVAGYSAGAFTALNVGLVNSLDDLPTGIVSSPTHHLNIPDDFSRSYITVRGGIQGDNDGNKQVSSINKIKGIVNLAGAVGSLSLIKAGAPSIYNLSGDEDETVPIGKGVIEESGYVVTYGAEEIFSRALISGVRIKQDLLGGVKHGLWDDCQTTKVQCNDIKAKTRTFLSDTISN